MKNAIILTVLLFVGLTVTAQETAQKKNKNAKYTVEVNGNCEQCKKRIEKAAYSVSGVKSAVWEIDSHMLGLIINEEKTNVGEVKKAIAKVGHDAGEVRATDEDYNALHSCCLYQRK